SHVQEPTGKRIRKLKLMLIIVGSLAGMFFVGVQLLQKYGYVSTVNRDKLGNDISSDPTIDNA
ncbi:MAG: hypothetical protein WBF33_28055, partial [Candidatus Nitrosopolaris sp.]